MTVFVAGSGRTIKARARLTRSAPRRPERRRVLRWIFTERTFSAMALTGHKIIRHKNPKGRTTWYRAIYYDEIGRVHKSPCYHCGNCSWARRSAQNWLYANIHIWCNNAHVEQRVVGEDGHGVIVHIGFEEIL